MVNKVNSKSELIINGNILKALLSLIIPMSIGMFSLLVINLVDAYYIGKLGVLELSAISYAFPVLFTELIIDSVSIGDNVLKSIKSQLMEFLSITLIGKNFFL